MAMFGMTQHGSGNPSVFAQKRLSVLNHSSIDFIEVRSVVEAYGPSVPTSELKNVLTQCQKGRAPDATELKVISAALGNVSSFTFEDLHRAIDTNLEGDAKSSSLAPVYRSMEKLTTDWTKHTRREVPHAVEYGAPILESHKYGWVSGDHPDIPTPTEHRAPTSDLSHYNDCLSKHESGRSVGSEFSAHGSTRLTTQTLHGIKSGIQHPPF
mmetsp:Transcript_10073/g.11771  ORF Transcript_10073/g.11771 Transcript_10073/m.11771 type:complete len:211 (-) Transcript_10073:655-1287(-)|eukprot:CAMPEP_0197858472 /NCGR_PEP_ID=MMETSP1438-20131217/32292_1 /TAXON_ID=1461541 /ORGANISM="Pterosperma sp., Strain CCMP1384" /LENGTH=210 /DNA_ID=CAMNT_0043474641 /DNA_START=102 /DNA_END=734 /DNA_ORIENTATION=-